MPCLYLNAVVSLLPELKRFLVPCVTCRLSMSLPVCLWGTLLLGVGGARRLEQLTVEMFGKPVSNVLYCCYTYVVLAVCCHHSDIECDPCIQAEAGPAWDDIDQTTLEEVQKSWAHSKCTEVLFNTSSESDVSRCATPTTLHTSYHLHHHITLHHTTLCHAIPHHTTLHYTAPH